MLKCRKVETFEFIEYDGKNIGEVLKFAGVDDKNYCSIFDRAHESAPSWLNLNTHNGTIRLSPGGYLTKDMDGLLVFYTSHEFRQGFELSV